MAKFTIEVTQMVEIELDETKFDDAFMAEYAGYITALDTIKEHAENLAWVHATGREDLESHNCFIDGYGPAKDMGIKARVIDTETEVISHDR